MDTNAGVARFQLYSPPSSSLLSCLKQIVSSYVLLSCLCVQDNLHVRASSYPRERSILYLPLGISPIDAGQRIPVLLGIRGGKPNPNPYPTSKTLARTLTQWEDRGVGRLRAHTHVSLAIYGNFLLFGVE